MSLLKKLHAPVYARRLEVLSGLIAENLREGDRVLDVGCGGGLLGAAIAKHPACPPNVTVEGCEKHPRGDEAIPTTGFDGYSIPAEDASYDVTILADVVHHEPEPERLLAEVSRVTKRHLVIKDHIPETFLAYPRICFMDWAANRPYGVKCLYRYFTVEEWHRLYANLGLSVDTELTSIDLYPPLFNGIFGKRLQYFALAGKSPSPVPAA